MNKGGQKRGILEMKVKIYIEIYTEKYLWTGCNYFKRDSKKSAK